MPFDHAKWEIPAKQGDIGGVALYAAVAIFNIERALTGLKNGDDITGTLEEITKARSELDKIFEKLTGWTAPNGE